MRESGLRNIRLALYTRVSTEDQAKEGYSLGAQLARLKQYADFVGGQVVAHYEDDHSGRTVNRPGYAAMMAANDSWDAVVVIKMDRIHRNLRNFLAMMDWLEGKGKNFVSSNEQLDTTTPHGRFFMVMLQGLAELESDVIGERVKAGLHQKLREGPTWATEPPFGYEIDDNGQLSLHPEQSGWVPLIFKMAAGDGMPEMGTTGIANFLNAKGVATRRGGKWLGNTVRLLLLNKAYLGQLHFGDFSRLENHTPLVTQDLYDRVHAAMARRNTRRRAV